MQLAAILIALAALGGLAMLAWRWSNNENPPLLLAIGHGILALGGTGSLAYAYSQGTLPMAANWALVIFLLAAVGGATLLFAWHLRGELLPIPIIVVHGLLAATGLGFLLYGIFGPA